MGRLAASHFLAALAYADYRSMWLATMSAGAAAWALIVARAWLVFTLSGSSTMVGLVTFAAMIPLFFVPPLAGFLADRIDRRIIIKWVFLFQIGHNVVLTTMAFTIGIEVWQLITLSFLNGSARAAQMPASQALIPNLVPSDKLLNGIALHSATQHASRLTGPLLIAPILATTSIGWVFATCTVLYCLSFLMIKRIQTVSTGVMEPSHNAMTQFLAGLNYIYRNPLILSVVMLVMAHCSLTMSFESLLPVLAKWHFQMGGEGVAYIMMGVGTGALITVVALAGIENQQTRGRLLFWMGVISGLSNMAFSATTNIPIAIILAMVMGASQSGFMIITAVIIQSIVPDGIRGRVMSIYLLHVGGMMAVLNLANSKITDLFSAPLVLSVEGGTFVVIMTISTIRAPLRQLYSKGIFA